MHRKGCMLMLLKDDEPFWYESQFQRLMNKLCIDLGIEDPYISYTPKTDVCDMPRSINHFWNMIEKPMLEVNFGFVIPKSYLKPEVFVKFLRGLADIIEEENKNVTD